MAKPHKTLWAADPHTLAKHRLLVRYLEAWLPIMALSHVGRLVLIDGFAGPGRYLGGEPGSPLLMLDTYLSHRSLPKMAHVAMTFVFIEERPDRVANLRNELAALTLPKNVEVAVIEGEFDVEVGHLLDALPPSHRLAPTFAFIDPFGYTGYDLHLTSRILAFPKCEVLIYLPLPFIARFINDPTIAPALTNLFGDESWKAARKAAGGKAALQVLHDLFLEKVARFAGLSRSFEIRGSGWSGYHLFFGTKHPLGMERMKEAMWKVDPASGAVFRDSTDPKQTVLFEPAPDLTALAAHLRGSFGLSDFTIEQARDAVLPTPFASRMHLGKALAAVESRGGLTASHPLKKHRPNTYPDGTVLRFTPPSAASPAVG